MKRLPIAQIFQALGGGGGCVQAPFRGLGAVSPFEQLCYCSTWGEGGFWGCISTPSRAGIADSGSSILQKHEPHHCDDHEEPSQDADADEDDVAGVLALDFAGVRRSPLPLLGIHQVFCLAEPGGVRASDEGHRGFLPLWLTLHLVLVDVLLVAR